ncbi:hypothetical protein HZA26_01105 [Candidatus Nomurabacteria bacterium]|nr:hypothetical protein [Candidatus Nomurabacteria bacterium]
MKKIREKVFYGTNANPKAFAWENNVAGWLGLLKSGLQISKNNPEREINNDSIQKLAETIVNELSRMPPTLEESYRKEIFYFALLEIISGKEAVEPLKVALKAQEDREQ